MFIVPGGSPSRRPQRMVRTENHPPGGELERWTRGGAAAAATAAAVRREKMFPRGSSSRLPRCIFSSTHSLILESYRLRWAVVMIPA